MAKKGARKSQTRHHKGGKKNRKWGRMKAWCAAYRASGRQEENRQRRIRRHLGRHPHDGEALGRLDE